MIWMFEGEKTVQLIYANSNNITTQLKQIKAKE